MYAAIFRAKINKLDDEYEATAARLKELAFSDYGCKDFVSLIEGNEEITISYWDSKEQIKAWKNDPEHIKAQQKGRSSWYKSVKVQVLELLQEYE